MAHRNTHSSERGASTVEMALLTPFLLLLLFGIIEFAWVFGQNLSVNHGAREAARLAAVSFGDNDTIHAEVCGRTDLLDEITLTFLGVDKVGTADIEVGDEVRTTVSAVPTSLTSFFNAFMPDELSSTVAIRIEQTPSWSNGEPTGVTYPACP